MERVELRETEKETLKKIFFITNKIADLYSKLLKLELEGKTSKYRNSEFASSKEEPMPENDKDNEYDKVLDELEELLIVEIDFYDVTPDTLLYKIKNYIANKLTGYTFSSNSESVVTQDYYNRIYRRILNIIDRVLIPSSEDIEEVFDNFSYLIPNFNPNCYSEVSFEAIMLICEKEVFKNYLLVLQSAIKNNEVSFKDNLIGSKYYLAFINPDIEENMTWYGFNLSKIDVVSCASYTLDTGVKLNQEFLDKFKKEYNKKLYTTQITKLLEMKDEDYDNEIVAMNAYLRSIMLRAIFLSMGDIEINDFNYEFHELIDNSNNKFQQRSIDLIISSFKAVKKDRIKQKELKKST